MKNFIYKISIPGILISCTLIPVVSGAQYQPASNSQHLIKVAANTGYNKASGFKRMMFGEHYRKEWATPVDVAILDMDTTFGGLTALKAGGGLQTKSLRLAGGNGKEYVLRSV